MDGTSSSVCFFTSVSLYFVVSGSLSLSPLRAYTSTSLPTPFKLCRPKDVPLNSFLFSNSSYFLIWANKTSYVANVSALAEWAFVKSLSQ